MITFNLEQPFLLKEVEEKISLEQQKISATYSKMLKYGLALLLAGLIGMNFYGVAFQEIDAPKDLHLILQIVWTFVTGLLIMTPLMIKPRVIEFISAPYKEASFDRLHDCSAFISMSGMEKHKQYVEDVRKLGRELTYFECDEIIKYWRSLAKK